MFGVDFLEILTRSVALAAFVEPVDAAHNRPERPHRRISPPQAADQCGMRFRNAAPRQDRPCPDLGG